MRIEEFNQKLSSFITDAKFLEKQDPERASKMWLKIAEFALEFSKQPGIDRDFKLRLWNQINIIIKRVKNEGTLSRASSSAAAPTVPNETDDLTLGELPSVPTDTEEEENTDDSVDRSTDIPEPKTNTDERSEPDFYQRIVKMEDELKQIPDFWKEIKANPYKPEDSIIPFTNVTPPDEDAEQDVVKVEKAEKSLFGDNAPVLDDEVDPYRGTKDFDKIKDPFGPSGDIKDTSSRLSNYCPLCGAPFQKGSKVCPKCGAELSL